MLPNGSFPSILPHTLLQVPDHVALWSSRKHLASHTPTSPSPCCPIDLSQAACLTHAYKPSPCWPMVPSQLPHLHYAQTSIYLPYNKPHRQEIFQALTFNKRSFDPKHTGGKSLLSQLAHGSVSTTSDPKLRLSSSNSLSIILS